MVHLLGRVQPHPFQKEGNRPRTGLLPQAVRRQDHLRQRAFRAGSGGGQVRLTPPFRHPSVILALALLLPALGRGQASPTPAATFTPSPTGADYSKAVADLEAFIPDEMDKHHVKGLSIALVDGGKVVW